MEWLINRRRMMFYKEPPPKYINFVDSEIWRLSCINWGDYNETVITDNGNDTVNIVTTYKSKLYNSVKKSTIISSEENVDNSQGTYTAGTTQEALGITEKQCKAITSLGRVFYGNTSLTSTEDFIKFTNVKVFNNYHIKDIKTVQAIYCPPNLERIITIWAFEIGANKGGVVLLPKTLSNITQNVARYTYFKVICFATTPPAVSTQTNNGVLYNLSWSYANITLYVPDDSLEAYKNSNWALPRYGGYSTSMPMYGFSDLPSELLPYYNIYAQTQV